MISDIRVRDPKKRPICPKMHRGVAPIKQDPSRFRRKKQFQGNTTSIYNSNFRTMPKDT